MALFVQRNTSELSDLDLIQQYQLQGNRDSISILYSRYISLVYGLCLKYFKEEAASKDAVMEIFEVLSIKLQTHQVENFRSWLYQVSKNHCLGILRKKKAQIDKKKEAEFMYSEEVFHPDSIDREDLMAQLEACIKLLPERQIQCIQLFYYEKQTYQDIMAHLELEWKHVRSFIQNGRRNLKNCMDKNRG